MSAQDYNIVRHLKLHEIQNNPAYKALARRYALEYCSGFIKNAIMKMTK